MNDFNVLRWRARELSNAPEAFRDSPRWIGGRRGQLENQETAVRFRDKISERSTGIDANADARRILLVDLCHLREEVRSQKSGVRSQESEVRSQKAIVCF